VEFARLGRLVVIFAVIAISTTTAGAWPRKSAHKARMGFLATSTLTRGTWGRNEATYLAELTFTPESDPLSICLVGSDGNEVPPLPRAVLNSASGTTSKVRCDSDCDRPYGELILRTTPSDPMAIVHERPQYQPRMDRKPRPIDILPCYRTVRR